MSTSQVAPSYHRTGMYRAILLAGLFAFATPLWLPAIGTALVVADRLIPADAIVPLAGGDTRVRYAADLLRMGYGHWLVMTDMARCGPPDELCSKENAAIAVASGVPAEQLRFTTRIVLSTYQEVQAIAELARHEGWHRLIIVTSPQHTRRTSLIASNVFAGSDIAVSVQPVVGYGESPADWWRSTNTRVFTFREYIKLFALGLGYHG